ncbi:DNA binding domain-containing protein, excisionase family [Microlunatus sagamiharensis]|uniref:DNA binding domain-containing protein, excisionase family n=1 Tax=Microlunatus sagamiharensis TaxID=546874 RepID=A0A1H2LJX6_9ACTN|nr:hypothetical protein [Microlunatus sagamiharensis]SDU81152.1 DNA binding domain-containing protein, excisionase family [Microlunatus sagamiharensis]
MTEHLVAADVIAERLRLTKHSSYTCLATKRTPAHRLGSLWRLKVTELDERVRNNGASQTSELSKKGAD